MHKNILVIGDSCRDVFIYCKCERLCPEAPVPLLDISEIKNNGGMAMNVYENLKVLTPNVEILTNNNWSDITKTRYIDSITNHMFIRIDHNASNIDKFEVVRDNIDFRKYSAIIISDYNKGYLSEEDIEIISKKHPLTFLDTKKILGKWAEDISFIKINRKEYNLSYDNIKNNKTILKKIIKTIGQDGAEFNKKIFPVERVEIRDLSGAGDTFLSSLVHSYLKTNDIEKSIEIANKHATIVVQKRGVVTIEHQ
jgi:D-beta-D-heptose 7-phosphate kinase/D-beta-D-heptose 1-phosphate adenosyltransferase